MAKFSVIGSIEGSDQLLSRAAVSNSMSEAVDNVKKDFPRLIIKEVVEGFHCPANAKWLVK